MNDTEYLKQMIALTKELERVASFEPFDPVIVHSYSEAMGKIHRAWLQSRRRRSWFAIASICFLLLMLAWIVYSILF
jgi:hypothetical protein